MVESQYHLMLGAWMRDHNHAYYIVYVAMWWEVRSTLQGIENVEIGNERSGKGNDTGRKMKQIKEERNKKELRNERRRNTTREKARPPET